MKTSKIIVGVSNRHIHLSEKDLEILFGRGHKLTKLKNLLQPGQFAAEETLTIAGPKGAIENVRVLGPTRAESQVEISLSDSFDLGIKAPIRESGDLKKSGTIVVIGPAGSLIMENKVIIAKRHIHMTPKDAENFNVKDKQEVAIYIESERSAQLGNVVIRVSDEYALECHLDLDEANAVGIKNEEYVTIVK